MGGQFIKPLLGGRRAAKTVKTGSGLMASTGAGATRAAIRDAESVGVTARETGQVADQAADMERRSQALESVEKEFKRAAEVTTRTVNSAIRAAGASPQGGVLSRLWGTMSAKDRAFLFDEAVRLVRGGKDVHNNMTGVVREIAVKYLPDVRKEVVMAVYEMRQRVGRSRTLSALDTGARGPVHLPTKKVMADGRGIELGTDRLIGTVRGSPQKVQVTWSDGTVGDVWVAGELDVSLAIEVKGKTNARAGVSQLEALATRGGRGYAVIDGQFWLLKYDPAAVKHVVVAPPGDELNAARKALASGKKLSRSSVVEIPKEFDGRIHGMADFLLKQARSYVAAPP